jgi:hypothetical protein
MPLENQHNRYDFFDFFFLALAVLALLAVLVVFFLAKIWSQFLLNSGEAPDRTIGPLMVGFSW